MLLRRSQEQRLAAEASATARLEATKVKTLAAATDAAERRQHELAVMEAQARHMKQAMEQMHQLNKPEPSAASRLKSLDEMKDLLTAEEYEAKRASILASI